MATMDVPLSWEAGVALAALNLLVSDDVERLATIGLERGFDSRLMRELAGGASSREEPFHALFAVALRECGVVLPSRPDAARCLARILSSEMLNGRIDALRAARVLRDISIEVGPYFHELDPFIHAESEANDRPSDRQFFEKAILNEAESWSRTGRGTV